MGDLRCVMCELNYINHVSYIIHHKFNVMRYSKLFGKTVKEVSSDIKLVSHKYLYQAGFIRESVAGRYFFLPLGFGFRINWLS